MQSSVISYDHEIFSELEVYPEQIISDHTMVTYRTMLTAAVFYCKRLALLQDGHEDEHRCDDLFPSHLQARFVSLSAADEAGNQHNYGLDKHKFDQKANTSTAIPLEHPSVVDSSSLPSKELSVCVPVEIDADLPSVEGKMTLEVEAVKSPASQCKWIPCAICHLDVTWPNVMHSDACRARTMHRCAACQRIVCVVCAPAGDQIAGDGMSQKHDLPNFSIALPHLGLFTPHRVCMHCYFDSSHPGL